MQYCVYYKTGCTFECSDSAVGMLKTLETSYESLK